MKAPYRPGADLDREFLRVERFDNERVYCEEPTATDDILYVGSEDEAYSSFPDPGQERRLRYEHQARRYIEGYPVRLLSTVLRGPFEKASGWTNPWRSRSSPAPKTSRKRKLAGEKLKDHKISHKKRRSVEDNEGQQTEIVNLCRPDAQPAKEVAQPPNTECEYLDNDAVCRVRNWAESIIVEPSTNSAVQEIECFEEPEPRALEQFRNEDKDASAHTSSSQSKDAELSPKLILILADTPEQSPLTTGLADPGADNLPQHFPNETPSSPQRNFEPDRPNRKDTFDYSPRAIGIYEEARRAIAVSLDSPLKRMSLAPADIATPSGTRDDSGFETCSDRSFRFRTKASRPEQKPTPSPAPRSDQRPTLVSTGISLLATTTPSSTAAQSPWTRSDSQIEQKFTLPSAPRSDQKPTILPAGPSLVAIATPSAIEMQSPCAKDESQTVQKSTPSSAPQSNQQLTVIPTGPSRIVTTAPSDTEGQSPWTKSGFQIEQMSAPSSPPRSDQQTATISAGPSLVSTATPLATEMQSPWARGDSQIEKKRTLSSPTRSHQQLTPSSEGLSHTTTATIPVVEEQSPWAKGDSQITPIFQPQLPQLPSSPALTAGMEEPTRLAEPGVLASPTGFAPGSPIQPPSTPTRCTASVPTPHQAFSPKSLRSFMTPSPEKRRRRRAPLGLTDSNVRPPAQASTATSESGSVANKSTRLPSCLINNKRRRKNKNGKAKKRVSWSDLVGKEQPASTPQQCSPGAIQVSTLPVDQETPVRRVHLGSPPPPELITNDQLLDEDQRFKKHFALMAGQHRLLRRIGVVGAPQTPVPKIKKVMQLLPTDSQQVYESPAVDAMAEAFVRADGGLKVFEDNKQEDVEMSQEEEWSEDEGPPPIDDVEDVLGNLEDFLGTTYEADCAAMKREMDRTAREKAREKGKERAREDNEWNL
ncbi:hypothetical protein OQA88_12026 [Cercophora sp. LCS_1]